MKGVSSQSGAVLMVVVFMAAVLAVLVLQFSYLISLDARMASAFRDSEEAYCLARAGVAQAMDLLAQDKLNDLEESGEAQGEMEAKPYDSLLDPWAVAQSEVELGGGSFAFAVVDEDRKFNINLLIKEEKGVKEITGLISKLEGEDKEEGEGDEGSTVTGANPDPEEGGEGIDRDEDDPWPEEEKMVDVLTWFFEYLELENAEDISGNLANWITSNDRGKSDYGLGDPGYTIKKAPMETPGEIGLIKDMTRYLFLGPAPEEIRLAAAEGEEEADSPGEDEPFGGFRSYFTVYSDGYINLNTASVSVIALGLRSLGEEYEDDALDAAQCLARARDELPFEELDETSLGELDCDLPPGLDKRFKVQSDFFTIISEGRVGGSRAGEDSPGRPPRATCRVRALVHRLDERMVILRWKVESPWMPTSESE